MCEGREMRKRVVSQPLTHVRKPLSKTCFEKKIKVSTTFPCVSAKNINGTFFQTKWWNVNLTPSMYSNQFVIPISCFCDHAFFGIWTFFMQR